MKKTSQKEIIDFVEVSKDYPLAKNIFGKVILSLRAVNNVSFSIYTGRTLGIVGESGSGKTTIGRLILGLIRPTIGIIKHEGKDILSLKKDELHSYRKDVQAIFQNPLSSLNPRMKIGEIVGEPLYVQKKIKKNRIKEKIENLLEVCGLRRDCVWMYPHQLSGGQRQRVAIARAISTNARVIVLDEPVSSLDVSIRAQILNLLKELQEKFNITYVFIAHDLVLVNYMSDYIMVMYLGRVVEYGPSKQVFNHPAHPYTQLLLKSILLPEPDFKMPIIEESDIFESKLHNSGCPFSPRCNFLDDRCVTENPKMIQIGTEHFFACHLNTKL
jgi:oligopeptide/dipeptide ABC transporter ATP-binding protein